ncbi:Cof-type HAD-IIB family hydrolase [Treponema primitia]|uniref:Cof-type HAD-IIB family hydrolase n=1 Tax=Treponema primitia TaxID=88058 RepID=UPI0002F99464|nr:Cof-type HAD-IIB family hydrolase [Treponema primitia]
MTSIQMLAIDLDDTLLRSDLTISFRTRNAIRKAEAQGCVVVLASGRIPSAMEHFARLLGLHKRPGYLICNNGTMIQESHTGKLIYEAKIPPKTALVAYDLAAAEGFPVQLYEDDIMYISRPNEFADYDQKLTGLRQVVVENFRAMVGNGCYKLLIPGDPMTLKPLENILQTYIGSEVTIFTSKPYFLEILPHNVDKGASLAKVAEVLGIPQSAVLAIGDSMNDEAMIRWAGIGVAMANGDDRIKDIAAMVTNKSNDDDGVADLIERYILGKEALPKPAGA